MLCLENLSVSLGGTKVLSSLSLSAQRGERIALIGPNGAGKSTLLRALAGVIPRTGTIRLDGRAIDRINPAERARLVAFLPQERLVAWGIAVEELVALGLLPHGVDLDHPGGDHQNRIDRILRRLELCSFRHRAATELSVGERARALLARMLITEAAVLLADEPVSALDPRHQLSALARLSEEAERGAMVMVSLHELWLVRHWATRILLLNNGQIIADGPPEAVFASAQLTEAFGLAVHDMLPGWTTPASIAAAGQDQPKRA
jgi:iron complex transport system ATP-binding protein